MIQKEQGAAVEIESGATVTDVDAQAVDPEDEWP